MSSTIRIATRKSPLALWQANFVKDKLITIFPSLNIELLGMLTTADKMLAVPLNKIGGKGLFVKELERAILERQADIAVHSIKDMPGELPDGLELAVILEREDPRDVFVSNQYSSFQSLPKKAVIGTSSLRRKAQLLALRPDISIQPLRGNVGSRIDKLDNGQFDAIILAAAGLKRIDFAHRICDYFSFDEILPAAGQGAIGIEMRCKDKAIYERISCLNHPESAYSVICERSFNDRLGGSCQFPIAAYANIEKDQLVLKGLVSDLKGKRVLTTIQKGPLTEARKIGLQAAEELIARGANDILNEILAKGCAR